MGTLSVARNASALGVQLYCFAGPIPDPGNQSIVGQLGQEGFDSFDTPQAGSMTRAVGVLASKVIVESFPLRRAAFGQR